MKLSVVIRTLHPRQAFRIARAHRKAVENVFLRLEDEGHFGHGEASPNAYYGECAEEVARKLHGLASFLGSRACASVEEIAATWEEAWTLLQPSRAAQCALDLALWDLLARQRGCTVGELALGHAPKPVTSFCTIGLSTPEEFDAKLLALQDFAAIKIKSDAAADLSTVRRICAVATGVVAVDANGAWSGHDLPRLAATLRELGVAFLEQPYPPAEDAALAPGALPLPIFADESCVTEADVEHALAHFDGINVKLVKCGGLTPALRMVRACARRWPPDDGRLHAGKQPPHRRRPGRRTGRGLRRS